MKTIKTLWLSFPLLFLLPGCASTSVGTWPQTPERFMAGFSKSGLFSKVEEVTVKRPFRQVVADVAAFSEQCINVRVTREASYRMKQAGGHADYTGKMKKVDDATSIFSVQARYNDIKDPKQPRDGMFLLAAKVMKAGAETRLKIYRAGQGNTAAGLREWANGKKSTCPDIT